MSAFSNGARPPPNPFMADFFPMSEELLIIDAQMLLEDIKKQLSKDLERCKCFYGVHFPELWDIIPENKLYVRVIERVGKRTNIPYVNLSDLLTLKERIDIIKAAYSTKGIDISDAQMNNIFHLCNEVKTSWNHCAYLNKLLKIYMWRVAPNLTTLLGPKSAARTIVHEGALKDIIRKRLLARMKALTKYKGKTRRSTSRDGDWANKVPKVVKNSLVAAESKRREAAGPSMKAGAPSKDAEMYDQAVGGEAEESKVVVKEEKVSEDEADDEGSEVEQRAEAEK